MLFVGMLTILFFTVFFVERRTMWIGFLFLAWLGVTSAYLFILLERYEQTVGIVIGLLIIAVLIVGFPFYLLSFIWLLLTSGRKLIKREGRRLQNFLSLAFGVFLIVWLVFSPIILINIQNNFTFFVFSSITISVYYFFFLMVLFALSSILNRLPIPFKRYDYIIVLGSGLLGDKVSPLLASRIDKGIECFHRYHKKKRPVKVIFTGGQGNDEKLPEAVAMADYAMEKGLPKEAIILEDKAVNTYENLLFSKQLIEAERAEKGLSKKYNLLTVTNNFHLFRALLWARKVGMKSDGVGAKTKFYFWLNALIREFVGLVYMQKKFHIALLGFSYVLIFILMLVDQYIVLSDHP